jgi:hypothetical protein
MALLAQYELFVDLDELPHVGDMQLQGLLAHYRRVTGEPNREQIGKHGAEAHRLRVPQLRRGAYLP